MEEGRIILILVVLGFIITILCLPTKKEGGKVDKRKNHPKSNHRNIR